MNIRDMIATLEREIVPIIRSWESYDSAGDLEHASVQVGLLDLRYAVCGGAVPAVADGLCEVAVLLPLEGVMEDERPLLGQPGGVVGRSGMAGGGGGEQSEEQAHERGREEGYERWRRWRKFPGCSVIS